MCFIDKVKKVIEPILVHFIGMCATILSIWAVHAFLAITIGENAKLFDILPIIYLAHAGDFTVFVRFVWSAIKEFKNV